MSDLKSRIKSIIKEAIRDVVVESVIVEDDFIISDARRGGYNLGSQDYGFIGEFSDWDDAVKAFQKWTKKNNYYPNLWYVNDHGNAELLDYDGNYTGTGYV